MTLKTRAVRVLQREREWPTRTRAGSGFAALKLEVINFYMESEAAVGSMLKVEGVSRLVKEKVTKRKAVSVKVHEVSKWTEAHGAGFEPASRGISVALVGEVAR